MRVLLAAIALTIFSTVPSLAQQFSTPEDLVETLYGGYFDRQPIDDFEPYFSAELMAELEGHGLGSDDFAALGFDPIIGSSRWEPRDFRIVRQSLLGLKAQVEVSFTSHGVPVVIGMELVYENDQGWQIAHLVGRSGDQNWCTNDLIAAGLAAARAKR